jgi:hypothetical protein
MGDGTKLAVAILVMWLSLVFFFFAFHPGGVSGVSNPIQMLKWLIDEFQKLTGAQTTAQTSVTGDEALNYPGYTSTATSTSDIGNANPQGGVQLA